MNPYRFVHRGDSSPRLTRILHRGSLALCAAVLLALFAGAFCAAQDIPIGVTYVCNGEHIYIEACNIRDLSDTATCMVAHPDHLTPSGLNSYTSVQRGALKKLLPTCTQPSARQLAAAKAFQQRQQDAYNANVAKSNQQMQAIEQQQAQQQAALSGRPQPSKDPETRAMNRCITAGRLPASCTGNALLGSFSSMIGNVTQMLGAGPTGTKPQSGPEMDGVFQGAGNWRLDFIDNGVLVNCAFLSPDQRSYSLKFESGRTLLVVDTTPKPLILTVHSDGVITGPGPVTIDGVVATGSSGGGSTPGHMDTEQVTSHQEMSALEAQTHAGESGLSNTGGGTYDLATTSTRSTYVPGASSPTYATFSHRRATCPALNLSSKGAGVGIQTMQTNLLKSVLGGDKGPPTPPGIRMHGIFAASTGFSVQFFPESAILGCGPDAARAYPYTVAAEGTNAVVNINAPDKPLKLVLRSDGSLDPAGSGPYQVHGRTVTGQDDNDNFTFAPLEQTCNLALLTPSKTIPSSGGTASTMLASGARASSPDPATLSTPNNVLGNATLSIASGLPAQSGAPNPLAGHPYVLLRNSYANALAKGGVSVPPGMSPYKYVATACGPARTPDCQKIIQAINASAASGVRADATGRGTFPGVPPGTYYLMISARVNNQGFTWDYAVQLKPGSNSITLDTSNATPIR